MIDTRCRAAMKMGLAQNEPTAAVAAPQAAKDAATDRTPAEPAVASEASEQPQGSSSSSAGEEPLQAGATSTCGPSQIGSCVEADAVVLRVPTRLEWVGPVATYLRGRAETCGVCDSQRADLLMVALHEALTNAIVHGNLGLSSDLREQGPSAFAQAVAQRSADPVLSARSVAVRFRYDGTRCRIRIGDEGAGFDYQQLLSSLDETDDAEPSGNPEDALKCSGRGILMMRAFVDAVRFFDGGREVELTLNARHAEGKATRERRRQHRRACWNAVRVLPVKSDGTPDLDAAWEALVRNASEGGLGLIQNRAAHATRMLLEFSEQGQPVYIPADVCHVKALDGGLYQIGCRFAVGCAPEVLAAGTSAGEATASDRPGCTAQVVSRGGAAVVRPRVHPAITTLLDRLERPNDAQERRRYPRAAYATPVQIRTIGGTWRDAFSRDLSRGGMAIVASFPLPLQDIELLVGGTAASSGTATATARAGEESGTAAPSMAKSGAAIPGAMAPITARIVRCQRVTSGVYDIGCQFT
jgi:anti-sigma regulatory factor (Ser/Thr protein kinase)